MTSLSDWIGRYAVACAIWCLVGLWVRWSGLKPLRRHRSSQPAVSLISAPPRQSLRSAWLATFGRPLAYFHRKSSRAWTCGYVCYHLAILLVLAGYVASIAVLALDVARGVSIPDYLSHRPNASSGSVGNWAALVFGNAELFTSGFLFGPLAPAFRCMAWLELPLAVLGNACLLYVVLLRRVGAVRHDLDVVTPRIRIRGRFSGQHLLVRLLILSIIVLEFAGRFEANESVAYYHAALACTLIALVPLTYLSHIALAPWVVWQALSRRRFNRAV